MHLLSSGHQYRSLSELIFAGSSNRKQDCIALRLRLPVARPLPRPEKPAIARHALDRQTDPSNVGIFLQNISARGMQCRWRPSQKEKPQCDQAEVIRGWMQ